LGALLLVFGLALALLAYTALGHPGGRQASSTLLHPLATPPVGFAGTVAAGAPQDGGFAQDAGSAQDGGSTLNTTAQPGAIPAQTAGPATPGSATGTPLVVLDNTGRPDLARSAGQRFTQGGWTVTDTSTFTGDILSTAAYYDPAAPGAQTAAEALQHQFPEIQRVRPKFVGLGAGAVIVVLTYDYSQG
jgi:LytR cell envelope-related transcriptional attenuator